MITCRNNGSILCIMALHGFSFFISVSRRSAQCCNLWNCVLMRDGVMERVDG